MRTSLSAVSLSALLLSASGIDALPSSRRLSVEVDLPIAENTSVTSPISPTSPSDSPSSNAGQSIPLHHRRGSEELMNDDGTLDFGKAHVRLNSIDHLCLSLHFFIELCPDSLTFPFRSLSLFASSSPFPPCRFRLDSCSYRLTSRGLEQSTREDSRISNSTPVPLISSLRISSILPYFPIRHLRLRLRRFPRLRRR